MDENSIPDYLITTEKLTVVEILYKYEDRLTRTEVRALLQHGIEIDSKSNSLIERMKHYTMLNNYEAMWLEQDGKKETDGK